MDSNRRRASWKAKYGRDHSSRRLKSPNISLCWASWACHRLSRHPGDGNETTEGWSRPSRFAPTFPPFLRGERTGGSRNLRFATPASLSVSLPPSPYARLQIYAPRLAALISESSRPAPSVMKEINLLFWGCPRDWDSSFLCAHKRGTPHFDDVSSRRIANLQILSLDLVSLSHHLVIICSSFILLYP